MGEGEGDEVEEKVSDAKKAPSRFSLPSVTKSATKSRSREGGREVEAMLALEGVDVYGGGGEGGGAGSAKKVVEAVTMQVVRGERVLLVGPNGVGKTSLLRQLAGEGAAVERGAAAASDIFFFRQEAAERLAGSKWWRRI